MKKQLHFKRSHFTFLHFKQSIFAVFLLINSIGVAQIYTWMKGTGGANQSGVYGTIGVPAATNKPGGREVAIRWKDNAGNFWMFGGYGSGAAGSANLLNDLWKYDPVTNEWTFMAGTSLINQLSNYGTMGVASASNKPGGRQGGAAWTDASGNLWMFGGNGYATGSTVAELNDTWKYDISTNQWTWMGGGTTTMQSGNYGQQGVAAASNIPGSRSFPASWKDASGNLWVFGGNGYDGNGVVGYLNDLWKYDMITHQWTWVSGTSSLGQNGVYGTQGVASTTNIPGGRILMQSWNDASGNLWLFSGTGYDATNSNEDYLNDVWKYNIATNEWTWVGGSSASGQLGVYGTMGVAAPANIPGARIGATTWTDATGNAFVFGGFLFDPAVPNMPINVDDMWKYNMATNQWTWIAGSNNFSPQYGIYGTQGVPATTNKPGSRSNSVGWVDASNQLWFFGGFGAGTVVTGELSDMWVFSNCSSFPTLSVSSSNSVTCAGNSAVLTASGAVSYSWSATNNTSTISIAPLFTSTYAVTGADANGCKSTTSFTQNVSPCTGIDETSNAAFNYVLYPNPNTGAFTITGGEFGLHTQLLIFNTLGQKVVEENLSSTQIQTHLQKGIYYYSIQKNNKSIGTGKLLIE